MATSKQVGAGPNRMVAEATGEKRPVALRDPQGEPEAEPGAKEKERRRSKGPHKFLHFAFILMHIGSHFAIIIMHVGGPNKPWSGT